MSFILDALKKSESDRQRQMTKVVSIHLTWVPEKLHPEPRNVCKDAGHDRPVASTVGPSPTPGTQDIPGLFYSVHTR